MNAWQSVLQIGRNLQSKSRGLLTPCRVASSPSPTPWLPSYPQPGYDALGLISCTGTNFLVRAKAFNQVGGGRVGWVEQF